jgi:membrane protein implicated in regulation of membrane protease activity
MDLFLVYVICFGVGLCFALISAFISHLFDAGHGGDAGHGHAEGGFGTHDMPGFSPLSPTTIATFITAFGGLGMIFTRIEATSRPWISAPLAVLGGLVAAAVVFVIFSAIFRATQSSSESRVAELVGRSGTIISPIPAGGVGEIAYVDGGTRYTAPARTEDGAALASGTHVYITRISGAQFYVSAA